MALIGEATFDGNLGDLHIGTTKKLNGLFRFASSAVILSAIPNSTESCIKRVVSLAISVFGDFSNAD